MASGRLLSQRVLMLRRHPPGVPSSLGVDAGAPHRIDRDGHRSAPVRITWMFSVCGPFWPWLTWNSTCWFSTGSRWPFAVVAGWWADSMKPGRFPVLNCFGGGVF